MLNITDKVDNTSGANGELTAAEFNDHKNCIQGAVTYSGQTLDILKTPAQFAKALSINGMAACTFVDSGSANICNLTPATGTSGLQIGDAYAQLNGAKVRFYKSVANTSTSVVLNIGQTTGTLIGAKNLVWYNGTLPTIGSLVGYIEAHYSLSNDRWELSKTFIEDNLQTQITAMAVGITSEVYGLNITNDGSDANNDIDISSGRCSDSTRAVYISLGSAIVKQTDAVFAAGTNQGCWDQIITAKTTTNRARSSNTATLTLNNTTGLTTGMTVRISGVSGTGYNIANAVITVSGSTITYYSYGANETTTADTGGSVNTSKGANCNGHLYVISKADGTADILGSLAGTTPILPSTYVYYRKIGTVQFNASGNIIACVWTRNSTNQISCRYNTPIEDRASAVVPTSRTLYAVSPPENSYGLFILGFYSSTGSASYFISVTETNRADFTPTISNAYSIIAVNGAQYKTAVKIKVDQYRLVAARSDNATYAYLTIVADGYEETL